MNSFEILMYIAWACLRNEQKPEISSITAKQLTSLCKVKVVKSIAAPVKSVIMSLCMQNLVI